MKTRRLILTAATALAMGLSQLAWAHALPKQQSPAAGAEVHPAPKEVRIVFDDELEPAFSKIDVTDAAGRQVNTAKAVVDAQNKKLMTVVLPPLPAGRYKVHWSAVAHDGHHTQGGYSFQIK